MKWWPFRREEKASAAGAAVAYSNVGRPVWTPRQFDRLLDEGFVKNAIGAHCVRKIATNAATLPLMLFKGRGKKKSEIEDHPLLDLLDRPSPVESGRDLLEMFWIYQLASGNGYVEAVVTGPNPDASRDNWRAPPTELWTLRPDKMKVVPGRFALPMAYEYEENGQRVQWRADPISGQSNILHFKEPHPLDHFYGLSRMESAASSIDQINTAQAHNVALMQNNATPSGMMVLKPIMDVATKQVRAASTDDLLVAEKMLRERHMGAKNAGRPLVLSGDIDWKALSLSPQELDWLAGKDSAARDVCLVYGVPFLLVVPGESTYNNRREGLTELWEQTILPLGERFVMRLNAWLAPRFGDDLRLEIDYDAIPALEPRRQEKRTTFGKLYNDGVITVNEARDALGFDAIEGGETLKQPQAFGGDPGEDPNGNPDPAPADMPPKKPKGLSGHIESALDA